MNNIEILGVVIMMLEKAYIAAIQLIKRIAIGFTSLKAPFSSRMHCLKAYS